MHFSLLAFVLVYSYIFRLASRAVLLVKGHEAPVLRFLEIFTIAFRGPVDSFVYMPKDYLLRLENCWKARRRKSKGLPAERMLSAIAMEEEAEADVVTLTLMGKARRLGFFTDTPASEAVNCKLFTTTYNMGECSFEEVAPHLASWIPLDMDIYVIGVQECMIMDQLGPAILSYLGGPEKYVMLERAIGSTATGKKG